MGNGIDLEKWHLPGDRKHELDLPEGQNYTDSRFVEGLTIRKNQGGTQHECEA